MQVPPGSTASVEKLTEIMRLDLELYLRDKRNRVIWLAKEEGILKGIVDFFLESPRLRIRFLGAIPPKTGTGTLILRHLAHFCLSKKLRVITAEVSKDDPRAWNFYFNHIGFQDQGIKTDEPGLTLHLAIIKPKRLLDNLNKGS
jgi:hypothetical protein